MTHLTYELLADYLRGCLSPDGSSVCTLHLARCSKCRNALHQLHSDECYCREIRGLLNRKRRTAMIGELTWPDFKDYLKSGYYFGDFEVLEETPDFITVASARGRWCYRPDGSLYAELFELPLEHSKVSCFVELVNPLMIHYDKFSAVFSIRQQHLVMDGTMLCPCDYDTARGEKAVIDFLPWFERVCRLEITPEEAIEKAKRQVFGIEPVAAGDMPSYLKELARQYFDRFEVQILEDSPRWTTVWRNGFTLHYSCGPDTFHVWGTLVELPPDREICDRLLAFAYMIVPFFEGFKWDSFMLKFKIVDHRLMVCAWPRTHKFLADAAINVPSNYVLWTLRSTTGYFEAIKSGALSVREAWSLFSVE